MENKRNKKKTERGHSDCSLKDTFKHMSLCPPDTNSFLYVATAIQRYTVATCSDRLRSVIGVKWLAVVTL